MYHKDSTVFNSNINLNKWHPATDILICFFVKKMNLFSSFLDKKIFDVYCDFFHYLVACVIFNYWEWKRSQFKVLFAYDLFERLQDRPHYPILFWVGQCCTSLFKNLNPRSWHYRWLLNLFSNGLLLVPVHWYGAFGYRFQPLYNVHGNFSGMQYCYDDNLLIQVNCRELCKPYQDEMSAWLCDIWNCVGR